MRIRRLLALPVVICCSLSIATAASTGPDDRPITDPKTVVSSSNSAARPAPIDDLYYTKSVFGAAWSPDGKQIVFTSDIAGRSNLWKVNASGGWPIQLTQSDERQYSAAWSPDGKWIVYQQDHAGDELWDLYAVPSDGGQIVNLTNTPAIREESPRWSHDGKTIAFSYKPKDGSQYDIALLDVATKKVTWVTDLKWETYAGNSSPDGKRFSYVVNEDGVIDSYLMDRSTNHAEKIDLPHGLNAFSGNPNEFAPQSDRVIVSHEASNQPGDLWVYDLRTRHANQLTFSAIASLRATPLPPSQIVHYKSFDGKIITALLWVPFNLKRDGSNPAIVLPHGGPTGQMVDYWNTDVAALASRGYVCIAPNPRGSTGYGLDFQKANFQDLGGGDLKDEIAGVDFLKATGFVDPKKVGIYGGSYGGFMTLMAIGKTPDIWAGAVDEYGIISWSTMLKS